jgi:acetyltransferase-like isoleucine patch superfamily enzyme
MIRYIRNKVRKLIFDRHVQGIKKYISIGNSHLFENFRLTLIKPLADKTFVKIGNDTILDCKVIFESETGQVIIGDKCYIGTSSIICRTKIEFGSNIMVAMGSVFYDHDSHSLNYLERQKDIEQQLKDHRDGNFFIENKSWTDVSSQPIKIEDNAWIGINCIILKGVTIGEGAIIGAGSVVTRNVPAWTIAAGNPAKVIKEIPNELRRK